MKRLATIVTVLTILVALPQAALAAERSETKSYTLGWDAVTVECGFEAELGTNVGGACFPLDGNETSASIVIEDITGLPTGGAYGFFNGAKSNISVGLFCERSAKLFVPEGAAMLVVYVTGPVFGTVNCASSLSPGVGVKGNITVTYELSDVTVPPRTEVRECLETVPASLGARGITDDGSNITLSVLMLLDGVEPAYGQQIFATAAQSYAPLGITLSATAFQTVDFFGTDAQGLLGQAKAHVDGTKPAGVDVVFTLTSKDIDLIGQTAAAGAADCVGGIRFPERSFAVGEVIPFENSEFVFQFQGIELARYVLAPEATARVMAHEIGHLMGGQHHFANCVEDADGDVANGEISPCSLMFNSTDAMGPDFDTLNGAVVRGHAVDFASP